MDITEVNTKSLKKELQTWKKPSLFIFDLDGCLAKSDDFVLTNQQAYKLDKNTSKVMTVPVTIPTEKNKNLFSISYMRNHMMEIPENPGLFDIFLAMCKTTNVAIVTSRPSVMRDDTLEWLKVKIEDRDRTIWRRLSFKIFYNESNLPSVTYKSKVISKLMDSYEIKLLIEDHPEVIKWAESKGIATLAPSTKHKNLNDYDLIEKSKGKKNDKLQSKSKKK